MLTVNQTLTSVRYAVAHLLLALAAVDGARFCSVLVRSLAGNTICHRGEMSGLTALCEMLKTNGSLRELKCAA